VGSFVSIRALALDDLIGAAQRQPADDDTPEMNEIVRRFEGLAVAVAAMMTPDVDLRENLANAGRVAMVVAVRHHQLGRPGFPAYARAYIVGAAKRELQQWTRTALADDFERVVIDDETEAQALYKFSEALPPTAERTWGSTSTSAAVCHLDDRQGGLLQLRFMDDFTLATIAKLEGTSEAAVSQRLATALRAVERYLAA